MMSHILHTTWESPPTRFLGRKKYRIPPGLQVSVRGKPGID